jgi:hypothetical protein
MDHKIFCSACSSSVALGNAYSTNKDSVNVALPSVKHRALDECLLSAGPTLSKLHSTDGGRRWRQVSVQLHRVSQPMTLGNELTVCRVSPETLRCHFPKRNTICQHCGSLTSPPTRSPRAPPPPPTTPCHHHATAVSREPPREDEPHLCASRRAPWREGVVLMGAPGRLGTTSRCAPGTLGHHRERPSLADRCAPGSPSIAAPYHREALVRAAVSYHWEACAPP